MLSLFLIVYISKKISKSSKYVSFMFYKASQLVSELRLYVGKCIFCYSGWNGPLKQAVQFISLDWQPRWPSCLLGLDCESHNSLKSFTFLLQPKHPKSPPPCRRCWPARLRWEEEFAASEARRNPYVSAHSVPWQPSTTVPLRLMLQKSASWFHAPSPSSGPHETWTPSRGAVHSIPTPMASDMEILHPTLLLVGVPLYWFCVSVMPMGRIPDCLRSHQSATSRQFAAQFGTDGMSVSH